MSKSHIITSLDIGSSSIKMVSVSKKAEEEGFEILGQEEMPSAGVRKGVVVDPPKVSEIIFSLKGKIEEGLGQRVEDVYVNINGSHLFSVPSRGLVSVSRADQKISKEDIERVIQAAKTISFSSKNKEIIVIFARDFIVDGEKGVKEPAGMEGVRLEVETTAVCGFSPYIRNLNQAVAEAGLEIKASIPTFLASAKAVLTPKEKELGVCVLDIGAGTTNLAVFEEGDLIHSAVFPIGSANITNDLAICLKTDIDTAERIKLEFGNCWPSLAKQKRKSSGGKKIKIGDFTEESSSSSGEKSLVFSEKELRDIVKARVSEIFDLTAKELKKISRQKLLPAGIVITGGGSKLPGIKELAKKEFQLPVRIGVPNLFSSLENIPESSVLAGLILEGGEAENFSESHSFPVEGILDKLKKIFNLFIP